MVSLSIMEKGENLLSKWKMWGHCQFEGTEQIVMDLSVLRTKIQYRYLAGFGSIPGLGRYGTNQV